MVNAAKRVNSFKFALALVEGFLAGKAARGFRGAGRAVGFHRHLPKSGQGSCRGEGADVRDPIPGGSVEPERLRAVKA